MKLYGICGLKGSGKDTAADFIEDFYGEDVARYAFSGPMKRALAVMRLATFDQLWGSSEKREEVVQVGRSHYTVRHLLQTLGTEWGRDLDPDIWVNLTFDQIAYDQPYVAIITDVRFPNEAQRIRDEGGELWQVIRPGSLTDDHSSEQVDLLQGYVTRTIHNTGSIDDLEETVRAALRLAR